MIEDELQILWSRRRRVVAEFLAHPEQYQECEQCRAITHKQYGLCAHCHGYRFLVAPERIRQTAREMGTRPFSLAAPVIPRIAAPYPNEAAGIPSNIAKPKGFVPVKMKTNQLMSEYAFQFERNAGQVRESSTPPASRHPASFKESCRMIWQAIPCEDPRLGRIVERATGQELVIRHSSHRGHRMKIVLKRVKGGRVLHVLARYDRRSFKGFCKAFLEADRALRAIIGS